MNRKILDRKHELYTQSSNLRQAARDLEDIDKVKSIRKKQDEIYKRFVFYSNIIKANDKIKGDK